MNPVRIAAAQTPEFRQDLPAALAWAETVAGQAEAAGAALVVFPEGFLQGYLTDERAARASALELASPAFAAVLSRLGPFETMIVLGLIEADGGRLFNTAVVIEGGRIVGRYRKTHLMKGEQLFEAGTDCPIFEVDGLRFGINICNDCNFPEAARRVAEQGASLIVCPANNMMRREAATVWKAAHNRIRGERCRETGLWLVSADVTGDRDGRIAWGPTAVLDPAGEVVAQLPLDRPGLLVLDLPAGA